MVAAVANANTAFFMSEESFFTSTIPSTMHPTALLGLVCECEDLNPPAQNEMALPASPYSAVCFWVDGQKQT
jgi:hypothetical protein